MKQTTMAFFAAMVALAAFAANPAQAREPRTLAGKCAKELGAKYDPVRQGWYYRGPNNAARGDACVQKKWREIRAQSQGRAQGPGPDGT